MITESMASPWGSSQEGARFAKQNGKNSYDMAPFHEVEWSIMKVIDEAFLDKYKI